MKIIKPSYEILTDLDGDEILKKIELCGRVCYKSEDKITSFSAKKFVKKIIDRGHESVLEHTGLSARFICNRGFSHECVRHRLASFSQESTRYCNYSRNKFGSELTFIQPRNLTPTQQSIWMHSMLYAERNYFNLLKEGAAPQIARGVLPIDIKTEIVVTANLREWRHILRLRTAKAAHPSMHELMRPLLNELKTKIPVIFDDITYEE